MAQIRPTVVLVASIGAWLLGLSIFVVAVAFVIQAVGLDPHQWAAYTPLVIGLAYCASGYLLWHGRVSGAVIGLVFSGLFIVIRLQGGSLVSATMLLHVTFVVVLLLAWAQLRRAAATDGRAGGAEAAEGGSGGG